MPAPPDSDLSTDDLREFIGSWQITLRAQGKAPATQTVYRRGVDQYLTFCDQQGLDRPLTRRALEAWLVALRDNGIEGSTARSRLTAVKRLTGWLLEHAEIDFDPFQGVKRPKVDEKVVEPLTDAQIVAMLATCKTTKDTLPERRFLNVRDEAIIRLMVETGLRAGEVIALQMPDVHHQDDMPHLTVHKSKTGKGRVVPFSYKAALALDTYLRARRKHALAAGPTLWLGGRQKVLGYSGLYEALRNRGEAAGIAGFHPHRMRHTAAHRWLAAGGSEGGLMTVAGWSRPDMLMRYTKAQAAARAAEEAKGLNLGEL